MKTISKWLLVLTLLITFNLFGQDRKLTLEQALAIANDNNKTLRAELLEEKSLHEETKVSRASMLPTLSAGGSYSYYFDRQVIFMPGSFAGNENEPVVDVAVGGKNVFNSYISLQQPIVAEASRRQIKASRINESIKAFDLKDTRANLHVDVTATYYRALLVKQSIELNKQSLSRNRKSLEDSKLLLLQGKSLKVDTLRNFIVVENLKTTIAYLENQHNVVMLHLAQLLGIDDGNSFALADSLKHNAEAQYLPVIEALYTDAIQSRPDIQAKKLNVELSKNVASQNRALRLPTISLVGAYQIQAQADDRKFESYRWPKTSFIGLQANIPVFSGNRINAKVRQSNLRLQSDVLRLEDATQKANTEVITLQNNLKEVFQRLSTQEKTVHAAEVNFNIVNDRYRNGLSTRLELSDAELALTEAKMNHLNTIFNLKIAKLHLDKALGLL